jgi:hypothetical protein
LRDWVGTAISAGKNLDDTIAAYPTCERLKPPAGVAPTPDLMSLSPQLHRLNLLSTFRAPETEKRLK